MKQVYLITIPSDNPNSKPTFVVTDDLRNVTGKYPFFMVQLVDFVTNGLS